MRHRITTTIACIVIAAVATDFISAIREHYEENAELTPIQVTTRKPMTSLDILIGMCPNEFGKLQEFLDCREKVVLRYSD